MATYELLKQEGSAKRAVFHTVHGVVSGFKDNSFNQIFGANMFR